MTLSEVLARVQQDQVVVIEKDRDGGLALVRTPADVTVVVYDADEESYEVFGSVGGGLRVERTTNG